MFRADIGRDNRSSDGVPGQPFARQEVIPCANGLPTSHPETQTDVEQQVKDEKRLAYWLVEHGGDARWMAERTIVRYR
jgi:hypothetical protein